MSPITHLLASWVVAATTTDNQRDCRLVALSGLAPDLDGIGLLIDWATAQSDHPTQFYARYHHYLFHGAFGAAVTALVLAALANRRWRVALLSAAMFHLHLICDLAGSRGPSPADVWPIYYLGPFTHDPVWLWKYQWPLDAWPNRIITIALLFLSFALAIRRGHSVVGVFNQRGDGVFVDVLRHWHAMLFSRNAS